MKLLTQTQAAATLGVSRNILSRWTRNGLVPVLRDPDSSRLYYSAESLDEWKTKFQPQQGDAA